MKRVLTLMVLLSLVLSMAGCNTVSEGASDFRSIKSYKDIPGITEDEIVAVEALKETRDHFSYGHMAETEAFILPDGTYAGFTTKFCALLSELFGIPFVQQFCEWDDLKGGLDAQRIDFTGDLTPTPARMRQYYMTHAIADRSLRIFTHVDSEEIKYESDINGLRVGSLKGSIDVASVEEVYTKLLFTTVDVDGFADAVEMLRTGEIDVFITEAVVDPIFAEYDFIRSKEFFQLVFTAVSLTTANPELEPIISVVNRYLEVGGIDRLFELYKEGDEEYARYKLSRSFTDEERAYLNDLTVRGGVVRVAYEHENYPVSFYNATEKEFQGIARDVLREIGNLTSIRFEPATDENISWSGIMEMLRTGEVSMVTQLLYTDARKDDFLFSDVPYCSAYYALISKMAYPNLSNYQVLRARVGNLSDSAYEDKFGEWFPDHKNTSRYEGADKAFAALDRDEVDLLMASEFELLEQVNYRENPGYKVNILFTTPTDSLFGFNLDERILCSIVDKAQAYVDTSAITNGWTSRVYDYSKQLAHERVNYYMIFAIVMFCVLIIVVALLFNNRRMSKNLEGIVKSRTRDLELQTAMLSTIYTSIPDLVFCKDVNSIYTSCNPSFEQFAGHTEAEIRGKGDVEIFQIDKDMAELFIEADKKVFGSRGAEVIEELITYPDGAQKFVETHKAPLIQNDEVIGMIGISRDITERKAAEAALKKRLEQQGLMADLAQSFISSGDVDGMITKALQATGEFMGISRILLVRYEGQTLYNEYEWCNPSGDIPPMKGTALPVADMETQIASAFAERAITHYNLDDEDREDIIRRYALDITTLLFFPVFAGDKFWGVLEFDQCEGHVPWTSSDINLGEMISGIFSGVMDRERMEDQLVRLSAIVESSPQFIAIISNEGDFEYFNPAASDVTGYSRDELERGGLGLLIGEGAVKDMHNAILPLIHKNGRHNYEIPITRKDKEIRIMSVSAFNIGGYEMGSGAIAMDITEMRRLENDLIHAKELAEQSSHAKSEFLSRMSHEMRTPMNAIIGMTSIAKGSTDVERKDYCLNKIDSASTHLLGVINDVLDMSKIEAGKFELSNTDFNLEKMLMKITNVVNFRMEEKKQHFIIKVDQDVPQAIVSDEQRLNQVITNLLSNAVKFTPDDGTISLFIRKRAEESGMFTLEFEVKDTGIGISEEQQRRLFTSFEQADGSVSRKYGGTGLGLAISKRIVEMMDGKIWVESEVGNGSSFIFNICARRGRSEPQGVLLPGADWSSLRILAVDDSEDARDYFLSLAEAHKLRCEVAASGEEACELLNTHGPFNIVFVDWKMPGMDGMELTRWIRRQYARNMVVIMISTTEWSQIETEAKQAGVDRFIPKPLFASMIIDCINECIGLRLDGAMGGAEAYEEGCFAGRHILLAEDVEINREIVITLLESTGIQIDCAENGGIAYRMFKDNPAYDMIFMDIHMPEVDGYESTKMIRALPDPRARTVPIIAMTANVFREDIERCLAAGMNDHIGKPLDIEDVLAKLRQYLRGDVPE